MALITKPDFTYVWASGGAVVAPNDTKKQLGWVAEAPPFQYDNWLQNRQDQMLAHINQRGIPAWDGLTNYEAGGLSYVQGSDGKVYKSVAASGPSSVVSNPTTDVTDTHWTQAFLTESSLQAKFQLSGPAAGYVNLKVSIPTASAAANFTADSVVVLTSLAGQPYRLPSFNKTLNLSTVGAGGMDIGTATASSWVGIYAIYNPVTNVSALLAVNAGNTVLPVIYGGANMPAGYTASALISVLRTTAGSLLDIAFQMGNYITHQDRTAINSGVITPSLTAVALAGNIPGNAKSVNTKINMSSSSGGVTLSASAAGSTTGIGQQAAGTTSGGSGAGFGVPLPGIPIITTQTVSYTATVGAGAMIFFLVTTGYTI